jgi:hypothetical protein
VSPTSINRRVPRLVLTAACALIFGGCTRVVAPNSRIQDEGAKCSLVHTLLAEQTPAQHLHELTAEGRQLPVPVAVFVRRPEQGLLERFFAGDTPDCGDGEFRVVRQLGRQGLVLYLQETQDGYTYDVHRAGPEELSMGGAPQGAVRRNAGGGWVATSN